MGKKARLFGIGVLLVIVILITMWGVRLAINQGVTETLIPFSNTCVFFAEDFNAERVPIEPTCSYLIGGHSFPQITFEERILGTALPVEEQVFGGWEITGDRVRCIITQTGGFQDNPIDELSQLISGLQTLPLQNLKDDLIVNCFDDIIFDVEEWELVESTILFDEVDSFHDGGDIVSFRWIG